MTAVVRARAAAVALAVAAVVVLVFAGDRTRTEIDLTQDRSLTLTETSVEIARSIDDRVRVTAFLSRREPGRAEAAALLERYRRENRRITSRVLDPEDAPGETRRLGVDPVLGGIAVESGDRVERGATASEQDVTAALARLARDVDAVACFVQGHGERPVDSTPEGMGALAALLTDNGYRVQVGPASYERCTVAVVAAATAEIDAADPLVAWLGDGGRALVLTDPESPVALADVLAPFGVSLDRGVVLETNPKGHVPGDPATPVVASYRSGFPFVRRLPPTIYPGAQGLVVDPRPPEGVSAAAVATTTAAGTVQRGDGSTSAAASVALVAASDRSRVEGERIVRSRVVVTGDADLLSGAFLGELGHERLAVQAIDWLALEEDLVAVSANIARPRPLLLTPARITYLRVLTAGIIPLTFLLVAAGAWAVRRSR